MGNNNVTPAKHAIDSYSSFFSTCLDDENVEKLFSGKNIVSKVDREFSLFVDDFLVNDEQLQEYTEKGKQVCVGALMFLNSTSPYDSVATSSKLSENVFTYALVNLFNDNIDPEYALGKFLVSKYAWDGSSFFEWADQTWTRCSDDSLNCSELVQGAGLKTSIRTCGLTQSLVVEGVALFDAYRKSFLDKSSYFKGRDMYEKAVEYIKSNIKKFDQGSNLIPCCSGAVKVTKGSQRSYKPSDHFLTKLPYDPTKDSTKLVSKFVSNLKCDSSSLATTLVRCGVSVCRTLTIISGPKCSGKSTVLAVIKALYGPFVCTQAELETGTVNTELVRTCLIDNSSFLSEDKVSSHPISNLVVTCESSSIEGLFGGRKVKTLVLAHPLAEDDVKSGIVTNLSTRKQLGSLLGWCLHNYDLSSFSSDREGSGPSSLLRMLIGVSGQDFN